MSKLKKVLVVISSCLSMMLLPGCDEDSKVVEPDATIRQVFKDSKGDVVTGAENQGQFPIDIESVTTAITSDYFAFEIKLSESQSISSPSTNKPNSLYGSIDIDLDYENDSLPSGPVFWAAEYGGIAEDSTAGVSYDLTINFTSEILNPGYVECIKSDGQSLGWAKAEIAPTRVKVSIPRALLEEEPSDGPMAFMVIVGDESGPTDIAPPTPGIIDLK